MQWCLWTLADGGPRPWGAVRTVGENPGDALESETVTQVTGERMQGTESDVFKGGC